MKQNNKSMWKMVELALKLSKYQTWDGCHKIYVIMDEDTATKFKEFDYVLEEPNLITIQEWFEDSCSLRFIDAVKSVKLGEDSNKGYITLIGQGEYDETK